VIEKKVLFNYSEETSSRLDLFLVRQLPEYSRSRLQSLIKKGYVLVDDEIPTKAGFSLEPGMTVEVSFPRPEPVDLQPESIPLEIIFENVDILLVSKPAGMVVHPSVGHAAGTLVHAALAHVPEIEGVGGIKRPGIIHRLDKGTSGLIVLAKNDRAHQWISDQFRDRQVEKTYLALVDGFPPTPKGKIIAAIARDPTHRKKMAVAQPGRGRESVSLYRTLESFKRHTYLEVKPQTGRTHQIRVHLSFIGCPVAGDTIYGHNKSSLPLDRFFLHAFRLKFVLPGEATPRTFEAALPKELEQALKNLRLED
jgi:23S rRNA pseudouridine1911/1915/1917 synthase